MKQVPIVVLISGTGSNLRAICQAIDEGRCAARVLAVISDRASAQGLEFAQQKGITTAVVRLGDYPDRPHWDEALRDKVAHYGPELVVLAGFMRVLGAPLLERFAGRVINLHPALLPLFPGTDGAGMAIKAGVRISGCSVHVVDAGVDTGPVIAQAAVRVYPSDDGDTLHKRIQRAEHRILPWVIDQVAKGAIELTPKLKLFQKDADDSEILFSPAIIP
jgi:phosphoribosylglycinamide formyltransferase-1